LQSPKLGKIAVNRAVRTMKSALRLTPYDHFVMA
jgi:hypothetical protein